MHRVFLGLVLVLGLASSAQAQILGPQSNVGRPSPNTMQPTWAQWRLSLASTFGSALTLGGLIPTFRDRGVPEGTILNIPDPDRNPAAYLSGFGFRRLR
ncbi:MAG: hypothetical protein SNJ82_13200 [Gemmataceae bacterium]